MFHHVHLFANQGSCSGGDFTSIHFGNVFLVLAALLLGGLYGGLAGAIGMTIADIMDPVYILVARRLSC